MTVTTTYAGVSYTFSQAEVYDCMQFFNCNYDDALHHLACSAYSNSPKPKMDYSVFEREPEIVWLGYLLWDCKMGV